MARARLSLTSAWLRRQGSITTLIDPLDRSPAMAKAWRASARGKRCVMSVAAISGELASRAAASSVSRRPWWRP